MKLHAVKIVDGRVHSPTRTVKWFGKVVTAVVLVELAIHAVLAVFQ